MTQQMSELKAFEVTRKALFGRTCTEKVYLKSEADKVIADLEESHKKEVSQLLILNREQANTANRLRDSTEQVIRHQKYKLCLAMAEWCNSEMGRETFACFRPRSTKEVWREEHKYWAKWRKIWLNLAKKFKEAK